MVFIEENKTIMGDLHEIAAAPLPWEQLRNKTLLITGAGGFLAAYLVKAILTVADLHGIKMDVIGVIRQPESLKKRLANCQGCHNFSFIQQDMSQPLQSDFPRADYIIHAASQASPKYYGIDPVGTLLPNTLGTARLLEHGRHNGVERFLFFSSGSIYGQQPEPKALITETDYGVLDPIDVRSCYGESKRMGETMCVSWAHQYDIHTSIVRPFHTYGPGVALDDGRVFADFVADAVAGRDISIRSDGSARRAFCYLSDATLGFLTILLKGEKAEAYNIGNPNAETSIKELAETITYIQPERNISIKHSAPPEGNAYLRSPILQSCPAIDKALRLGWAPQIDIKEGFQRTIMSFL